MTNIKNSQWVNITFVPEYGENIESFLNKSDELEFNDTFLLRSVRQYYDFDPSILIFSLFPFSLSIVLQVFAIKYEKTEMDPMKRGFTNQVKKLKSITGP